MSELIIEDAESAAPSKIDLLCGWWRQDDNCKSGALYNSVMAHEWGGEEEDLLAKKDMSWGAKIEAILCNCLVELLPSAEDKAEHVDSIREKKRFATFVSELPIADRMWLLIQLRKIAPGRIFKYSVQCPYDECKNKQTKSFDLNDVKVAKPSDPRKQTYDVQLSKGRVAKMRFYRCDDESTFEDLTVRGDNRFSAQLMVRLIGIDGKTVSIDTLKKMKSTDRQLMRDAYEEKEPDLDLETELKCSACGKLFRTEVPVGSKDFFFPLAASKISNKRFVSGSDSLEEPTKTP